MYNFLCRCTLINFQIDILYKLQSMAQPSQMDFGKLQFFILVSKIFDGFLLQTICSKSENHQS